MPAVNTPFDHARLDRLMDEAGMDVLLATSKHNVQYLLGGHRAIFFDYMDAMGLSRYLPIVVYPKGKPDKAAFFGHRLEGFQKEVKPFWTPEAQTNSSGALDVMPKATDYLKSSGVPAKRIGIETTFMPMDAGAVLRKAMPDADIKDALVVLERQRLRKSPDELAMLKVASEKVIDSMMATIAQSGEGTTKAEFTETLRREEVNRGLTFEYCLIACGKSHNRAPSRTALGKGRRALGRFRRQLSRLHRRSRPHGDPRRARCRAARPARRDRDRAARRVQADQGRRHGRRNLCGGRGRGGEDRSCTTTWNFWRTAWAWSATRRRT